MKQRREMQEGDGYALPRALEAEATGEDASSCRKKLSRGKQGKRR